MSEQRPTQSDLLLRIVEDIAEIKATIRGYAELEARVRKIEGFAVLFGIVSAAITATVIGLITKAING
jgi:hypothetical protein